MTIESINECSSFNVNFNDWRWQIKNNIKTVDGLLSFFAGNLPVSEWIKSNFIDTSLPFSVTPYFASLMNGTADCPLFLQVIANVREQKTDISDQEDPLGEEERSVVPHLVHRYPDRVLFLATDRCASYCRFCQRKRWVGQGPSPKKDEQEQAFSYIEKHGSIKEIIFSGGDPFVLSNQRIHELLSRSFSISHIEVVRFHSRILCFLPMRIDEELCNILKQFSPLYFVTHFNHPNEITTHTIEALKRLSDAGVVLLNQSVLLKNINDDEKILQELFRKLIRYKVRPYYVHQCDVIFGARHFRVPIKRSIELLNNLRGNISGLCQPTLVIDIPGGHGKVPLTHNPIIKEDDHNIYLQGFLGQIATYPKD